MRESDLTVRPGMSKQNCSRLFEIARVLVCLDHVARIVATENVLLCVPMKS